MSVRLWNKWLWNWLLLQLLKLQISRLFRASAPWHSDNYRVYIHSKTWMWHDKKNTQLKKVLATLLCLINLQQRHFIFSMVEQLQSRLARIGSKWFLFIWSEKHFLSFIFIPQWKKSQEKPCLPNWFIINIPEEIFLNITEEILSPTTFVIEWTFIGYCKTSDIFWLIFSVSSPPSLTTMRFPHSSLMNTSLGESSKFPMSSISMQSSSSSTITFFSEELLFLTKP